MRKCSVIVLFLLASLDASAQNGAIPASFFGVHLNQGFADWPPIPFGTLRLWDVGGPSPAWSKTQTCAPPCASDFTNLSNWLTLARHYNTTVIVNLGRTPLWATPYPNANTDGVASATGNPPSVVCSYNSLGGPGQCFPPKDIVANQTCWGPDSRGENSDQAWGYGCGDIADGPNQIWKDHVTEWAGYVNQNYPDVKIIWEMWNEVDSPGMWCDEAGHPNQLAKLTTDAAYILNGYGNRNWVVTDVVTNTWNEANPPSALWSHTVTASANSLYLLGVFGTTASSAGAINYHAYLKGTDGTGLYNMPEEKVRQIVDPAIGFYALVPGAGTKYPLYDSEDSFGTANITDANAQMAYVARTHLLLWANGVQSVSWYTWDEGNDSTLWGSSSVLGNRAGTSCKIPLSSLGAALVGQGGPVAGWLCPAGLAYHNVANWMIGNTMNQPCSGPLPPSQYFTAGSYGVWTCGLLKPDGTQMLAVWDTSQACLNGTCTYSNYQPDSQYIGYYALPDKSASQDIPPILTPITKGASVQIGAKPILLIASSPPVTTVRLTSGTNPSSYGQTLVFTGTVTDTTGSGTPTGLLNFTDSVTAASIPGCAAQTLVSGSAACTVSTLAANPSHIVTASYSGDSNYPASTSPGISQNVSQATPVLSWTPQVATLNRGAPLSGSQLNAAATVPGSFSYTDSSNANVVVGIGTVLTASAHVLVGTFTPTDATDYVSGGTVGATITITATPSKVGAYNGGQWYLDVDGNGTFDSPPDVSGTFGAGLPGAIPVTGDWNGDGRQKMGVYYQGFWFLDFKGDGTWDGGVVDKQYNFGWSDPNVIPVVGDWNGDGRTKIGVYYQGFWYLDYDGNGIWDGGINDKAYNIGWPAPGVTPIVGDWSGSGTSKIGIYYYGFWYLDYDGDGVFNPVKDKSYNFGWQATGVTPIMGDWNGDGRIKIGIYYYGFWYLDYDGNGAWDGGVNDKQYNLGWPDPAVTPVMGDWTGTGTTKIGIFYDGYWYLDFIGNGIWDGGIVDKAYVLGQPGDTPIVGKW
jgi:hypothetical protein